MLALRWSDVDLETGTVEVRHTLQRGTRTLASPKTENARRRLRLGQESTATLRELRRFQLAERIAAGPKWCDRDFVFTTPVGAPLHATNVLRSFKAALARAGLPLQRFHDLRHACATLLLEQGEELGVISKVLGHSTLSTTLDIYGHLTDHMTRRVADRMDDLLRKPAVGA